MYSLPGDPCLGGRKSVLTRDWLLPEAYRPRVYGNGLRGRGLRDVIGRCDSTPSGVCFSRRGVCPPLARLSVDSPSLRSDRSTFKRSIIHVHVHVRAVRQQNSTSCHKTHKTWATILEWYYNITRTLHTQNLLILIAAISNVHVLVWFTKNFI